MNIVNPYIRGLHFALKSVRLTTLLYVTGLLFALVIVLPFHATITKSYGHSMSLDGFLKDFNYTAFAEFFTGVADGRLAIFRTLFWLVPLFLLVQVFLKGGILTMLQEDYASFSMKRFFEGCGEWFFRFFLMSVYLLVLMGFLSVLVGLPASLVLKHQLSHAATEQSLYNTFFIAGGVYMLFLSFILLAGEYGRYMLFSGDSRQVLKTLWRAAGFVIRKIHLVYGLLLMLALAPLALAAVYFLLNNLIGTTTALTILLMFIIQQAFIWARNMIRLWVVGGQFFFFGKVVEG